MTLFFPNQDLPIVFLLLLILHFFFEEPLCHIWMFWPWQYVGMPFKLQSFIYLLTEISSPSALSCPLTRTSTSNSRCRRELWWIDVLSRLWSMFSDTVAFPTCFILPRGMFRHFLSMFFSCSMHLNFRLTYDILDRNI